VINLDIKFPETVSRYMQSDARHRFIAGPFGSGKTVGGLVDIVRRAQMQRVSSSSGKRKSRWAVVRNTMPQLRGTTMKSWFDWFPNGSLGYYQTTTKTYYIKQGDVDAEVIFTALDTPEDVKNLLSLELTGALLAEYREIPREIVEALDGRIGRYPRMSEGGPSWVGMWGDSNMPEEGSYWHAKQEGRDPDDSKQALPNDWDIYIQPAAMLKTSEGYVLNPRAENLQNLPADYYQQLIKDKTEDFIRVNVLAQYGRSKGGRPVHPEFSRDLHVAKSLIIPNRDLVLLVAADFGLTPAIVLKQQNAFDCVLTLDEVVTFDMGLERAIETKLLPLLAKKYKGGAKNGEYEIIVTGDPSGETGSQSDETSCVDIFREYKRHLGKVKMASTNAPVARRGGTDHFLVARGTSTYLVDPNCDALIAALSGGFMFKRYKDGRHGDEVEKNDHSHVGEASEYADMYFAEGRRRKAENRSVEMSWDEARRAQHEGTNHYAMPR